MAGYFELAGEAIQEVLAGAQPAASGNWLNIVPKTDWGMSLGSFIAMVGAIINSFNAKLAPERVKTDAYFDELWGKPLSDLQWALSESVEQ
jgi:hypothetical protein